MSCEYSLDDVVTEFLLKTCRLRPHATRHAIQAAMRCSLVPTDVRFADCEPIPLITGSGAEFYIEPMLPLVGDIDVMTYRNNHLAVPRGHPPPTQLPVEFHNCVVVAEIIDSHLPGYVYLPLRYLLTECTNDDKYIAIEHISELYLPNISRNNSIGLSEIHGPALCQPLHPDIPLLSLDSVPCVRCLSWPPQADDWPTRHRNYGWPDSATLDRVVGNGCDVVGAVHRQCRQHEWMSKHQHRLSFSRAEIVLINSWMPVQQIVYHVLRFYIKSERLTDCADDSGAGTLSNYHIKTLMLWACELKPRSWWTDDVNLVRMCVQLLRVLAEWLTDARCQHYFINNCNLIDNSFNLTDIRDQLMSIDEMWLSTWFVDNYIQKCLQRTPCHISRLFDDVSTSMKLQNAVSALAAWRQNHSLLDLWEMVELAEHYIPITAYNTTLTALSCVCWNTVLGKVDSRLSVYFKAVVLLHVAYKSLRHLTDEMMDVLATFCGQLISRRHYSTSHLCVCKAVELMKVAVNKSLSTMSLIEIELSKAYLYRAMRCKDSDSDSIYCLTNVYLAVLYYTTGHYQTAIDHCTLVTRSQDHSQCSEYVVLGEILPKINGDIDNMLGLAELYQSVRTAALNQKPQAQPVAVFTTELFAYYLHIKYHSDTKCLQFIQSSLTDDFKRYGICVSDTQQLYICDVLLFLSISRQKICFRRKAVCLKPQHTPTNAYKYDSLYLVELLQKYAVEHLTTYRQNVALEFLSEVTIVTTDFEALYAYKRGDYQRCLQLSTQNVHTLLYADHMPSFSALPQFIQLLDDDIVSLTGLTMIASPGCRARSYSTCISQLTLSLYLMTQCQLKLHHSVTSLAQTLDYIKVAQKRCAAPKTLDLLTLKMTKRLVVVYVNSGPVSNYQVKSVN